MPAGTYAANKFLDLVLRGVAWTPPTDVFVSLHTASPGNDGANEVTTLLWPGYVRRNPDNGGAIADGWSAATGKATSNLLSLVWPIMNGPAGVIISHLGVWDAANGGNFLIGGPMNVAKALAPFDEFALSPGIFDVGVA